MADTPVSINNFIYDEETYSAKYDKDFFVIPFISMNDGHTPAQIRTQNRGLYKDIQRAPFLRKSGVFTEDGTINDIDITSLVYYGTLEQSKIAPTLENIDVKLYFREPKLTKVPDTVNSGKYADSYIWREVQPGFHVYNNDTVYGYEWMILQDDYVHTDGVYNLHMNIEDGLGVCKFAGTQAPISLKGIQYKIIITAKNLWTREFSLIDSMPLIKSLNSVTDDLAPSVKAVREYYEKALETLKVVTETLTVKTEDDVWLETRKDEETGREYIYIKDLQLGEIPNIGELVTTLIDDLSDHVKDAIDDAATDEKGELIGVHGIQNKGIKGNLNAKKLDGATLSNGMQGVEEDVNELSYIPYVDDKNTIGLGTVVNQYSRSSGKDPIPVYRTILESQDSAKTLRLKRYSLDTDLTELLETVAYGANTINYRFTKTDSVPTIKITSGKNEEANAALNVSCVFTDKIDFGGYADKKFVITAAKIAYWDGASSIAYKKMHSELIDTKLKTVNDFYNLTPNLSTDADGKPVTTQNTAGLEDSNLLVPDFKSDLAAFTKLGSALQALYELPIGTYEYKRGSAEYKEQLGIFVERVNQVRDHLQELVGSGENENGMPTQDNFVVHKRNTWIKSKHANVKDREVGLGDLADVRNIYTGRSDTNAYSYTSEEINSIVNYLNLVTSKDELGQEIRNTVGILLKAAKEAQERLLDVETAIYGWDAATVPGDDKAKKAFIDNHVAQNLQEQINNSPLLLGLNRLMRALLLEIYDTTDLEKLDAEIESRVTDSDSLEEKATVKSRMDQIDEIMSVLYSQQSAMIKFYVENVAKDEAMHTYTDIVSKDGKQRITKDAALTEEDPGVDLADDHSEEKDRDEGRTWRNLPSKEDITDEAKATVGFAQVADAAHRHTPNKDETGLIRVPILATKDTDNVSEGDIEHTDKSEYVPENSGETRRFWDLFKLDKYKNNYTDDYAAAGTYNPFFKTKAVAWEKAKLERINAKLSEVTKTIYGTDDVQASLPNRTEVLRRNITNLVDDLYPNRSFEIENPVETPTDLSAELFAPFKNSKVQKPAAQSVATLNTDEPVKENHTSIIPWIDNEIFNFKIVNHYIGKRLKGAANSVEDYEHNKQVSLEDRENFNLIFDTKNLVTDATPFNEAYGTYYKAYSRLDMLENLIGVEDCYITNLYADDITNINDHIISNIDKLARGYGEVEKVKDLEKLISEKDNELKNLKANEVVLNTQIEEQTSKIAKITKDIEDYKTEITDLNSSITSKHTALNDASDSAENLKVTIGSSDDTDNSSLYAQLNKLLEDEKAQKSEKSKIEEGEGGLKAVKKDLVQFRRSETTLTKSKEAYEQTLAANQTDLEKYDCMQQMPSDLENEFTSKGQATYSLPTTDWLKQFGINSVNVADTITASQKLVQQTLKDDKIGSVFNGTFSVTSYKLAKNADGTYKVDENGNYVVETQTVKPTLSDEFTLQTKKTYSWELENSNWDKQVPSFNRLKSYFQVVKHNYTITVNKIGNTGGAGQDDYWVKYIISVNTVSSDGTGSFVEYEVPANVNVTSSQIGQYSIDSLLPSLQTYKIIRTVSGEFNNENNYKLENRFMDLPWLHYGEYGGGTTTCTVVDFEFNYDVETINTGKIFGANNDKFVIWGDDPSNQKLYILKKVKRSRQTGETYWETVTHYEEVELFGKKHRIKVKEKVERYVYEDYTVTVLKEISNVKDLTFLSNYCIGMYIDYTSFREGVDKLPGTESLEYPNEEIQNGQLYSVNGNCFYESTPNLRLTFKYEANVSWTGEDYTIGVNDDGSPRNTQIPKFAETILHYPFPISYVWEGQCNDALSYANNENVTFNRSQEYLTSNGESLGWDNAVFEGEQPGNVVFNDLLNTLKKAKSLASENVNNSNLETLVSNLQLAKDNVSKSLTNIRSKIEQKENEEKNLETRKTNISEQISTTTASIADKKEVIKGELKKLNEALNQRDKIKFDLEDLTNQLSTAQKRKELLENVESSEGYILKCLQNNLEANVSSQDTLNAEIAEAKAAVAAFTGQETSKGALDYYLNELSFKNYSKNLVDSIYRNDELSSDIQSSSNVGFVISRKIKPIQARVTTVEAYLDSLAKAFAYADNLMENDQEAQSELKTQANMSANKRFEVVNSFLSLKQVFNISEAIRKSTDHRIYDLDLSESLPGLELHNSKVFQALKFSRNASKTYFVLDENKDSGIYGSYSITAEFIAETNTLSVQDVDYFTALALSKYGQFTIYVQYILDNEKANITPENAKKNTIYLRGKAPTENLHKFWKTDNSLPATGSLLENAKGWQNQTEYNVYKTVSNLFTSLLNRNSKPNGNPESDDGDNLYYQLMLLAHPIGSVYISMKYNGNEASNPAELFGGKWQKLENGYLLPTDIAGNVNEFNVEVSKANNLTVENVPKHGHITDPHTHSFNHNHLFSGTTIPEICDLDKNIENGYEIAVSKAERNGLSYQTNNATPLDDSSKAYTFTTTSVYQNFEYEKSDDPSTNFKTGISEPTCPFSGGIRNDKNEEVETEPIDVKQIPHINVNAWVRIA